MKRLSYAQYPLAATGTIRNWLKSGTHIEQLTNLAQFLPTDGSPFGKSRRWILNYWAYDPQSISLKNNIYRQSSLFTWQPEDSPIVNQPAPDGGLWRYVMLDEDGAADFSNFNFMPNVMRGWLTCELASPIAQSIEVEVQTIGPVQVWVNDALVATLDDTFSYVETLTLPLTIHLTQGVNRIYLHGLTLGWREARLALGLRIVKQSEAVTVQIPLGEIDPVQWQQAETQLSQVYLKQYAFPELPATITLDSQADSPLDVDVLLNIPIAGSPWAKFGFLELPEAHAKIHLTPGESSALPLTDNIARAFTALPGENSLNLTLKISDDLPLIQHHEIWASANSYSAQPYGDYEARLEEARQHLARMSYDVLAAMAKVEAGHADTIDSGAVTIACEFMENRYDCADFYAVSLLALLYRFGEHDALLPQDKQRIEAAFFAFKFWIDEPGLDAMCYFTENHQVLFHVSAYLAGHRWQERVFANSGLTGKQQRDRAYPRIREWILRRLQGGYSEWDSNAYLALDVYAMLALVEFAPSQSLREMATTLLHKTFFMIAMQSYRGTHGSTHGRCYVHGLKTGRMENTSSLQRIGWGMGIFNGETRATGMLSLARNYRIPEIIQRIGADIDRTITTLARAKARFRPQFDMRGDEWDVSTITRRTTDYMLAAAVDHRPGERGVQEHLWQVTLSSEAVVFTTYPGNNQEHGHARPNFWSGSARLPRVGMHHRTVMCLYRFESGVGLGFSHAYFPTTAFDAWHLDGQWAFARKGEGYVALWGDGALSLTDSGKHVAQELRSKNGGHGWLCTVGSAAEDGDFASFMAAVKANQPQLENGTLAWRTPQRETLKFGWTGDFMVDDVPLQWDDFPHYRNAYTDTPLGAEMMTITHNDDSLVLDLARGRVVEN